MNVGKAAEEYVKRYFKEERGIELVRAGRSELGYDFRDESEKLFVEVKGTTKDFRDVIFHNFTNSEYAKAKLCQRDRTSYEIHLIVGMRNGSPEHYVIPGKVFLDRAKPEVQWYLPIRKDLRQYKLASTADS